MAFWMIAPEGHATPFLCLCPRRLHISLKLFHMIYVKIELSLDASSLHDRLTFRNMQRGFTRMRIRQMAADGVRTLREKLNGRRDRQNICGLQGNKGNA